MARKPAKSTRRRPLRAIGVFLFLGVALVAWANYHILTANRPRLYTDLKAVPASEVALVLGTSSKLQNGRPNPHFNGRIETAAALYRAGKVRHILVSGDNQTIDYNEPTRMKAALAGLGIPTRNITCDYAGFRTLDSVIRAQSVFGLKHCIIVTQRYHNSRALEIARATGLDAYGFCTPDVGLSASFMTECREVLARTATILDLYVWHRGPRFSGPPEPIELPPR